MKQLTIAIRLTDNRIILTRSNFLKMQSVDDLLKARRNKSFKAPRLGEPATTYRDEDNYITTREERAQILSSSEEEADTQLPDNELGAAALQEGEYRCGEEVEVASLAPLKPPMELLKRIVQQTEDSLTITTPAADTATTEATTRRGKKRTKTTGGEIASSTGCLRKPTEEDQTTTATTTTSKSSKRQKKTTATDNADDTLTLMTIISLLPSILVSQLPHIRNVYVARMKSIPYEIGRIIHQIITTCQSLRPVPPGTMLLSDLPAEFPDHFSSQRSYPYKEMLLVNEFFLEFENSSSVLRNTGPATTPSCSSVGIQPTTRSGSTCTSSTRAVSNAQPAGVAYGNITERQLSIDTLFAAASSRRKTGSVSSNIYMQKSGQSYSWSSETITGSHLLKFDLYPMDKIQSIPPREWWRSATVRGKVVLEEGSRMMSLFLNTVMEGIDRLEDENQNG